MVCDSITKRFFCTPSPRTKYLSVFCRSTNYISFILLKDYCIHQVKQSIVLVIYSLKYKKFDFLFVCKQSTTNYSCSKFQSVNSKINNSTIFNLRNLPLLFFLVNLKSFILNNLQQYLLLLRKSCF